jgi:hypothetical protein
MSGTASFPPVKVWEVLDLLSGPRRPAAFRIARWPTSARHQQISPTGRHSQSKERQLRRPIAVGSLLADNACKLLTYADQVHAVPSLGQAFENTFWPFLD